MSPITPGDRIRDFRSRNKDMTLDELCDRLAKHLSERPSKAKLSRIETSEQPVPDELIPALVKVTDIPAVDLLKPELAKLVREGAG